MSGINKRTVFVDVHKKSIYDTTNSMTKLEEFHKFWDWALVQTDIGPMAEPFQVGMKYPHCTCLSTEYDPENMMTRIDEIKVSEYDSKLLSGGHDDPALNGGRMMTWVGR